VLGPLPPLYRWVVCILALVACIGAGAWLAATLPVPLMATTGVAIGVALGVVLVGLLLRGSGHARPRRMR
jgi:hypothetical protein